MENQHQHSHHRQHHRHHHRHRRDAHSFAADGMSSAALPQDDVSPHQPPILGEVGQVLNIFKRSSSSSSSSSEKSSKTCGPDDNSPACQRPVSDTTSKTLPIALGVAIPVTVAIIILFILHRRQVRKLRQEDAADKHNSDDFGLEHVPAGKKGGKKKHKFLGRNGGAEDDQMGMTDTEKSLRRGHQGMSLEVPGMSSPYFLPPELQGSQESFHSLSRTAYGRDDKYRGATAFPPRDNGSAASFHTQQHPRPTRDDGSSYTASSSRRQQLPVDDMNHNLLGNAQTMSKSPPPPPLKLADNGTPLPSQPHPAPYPMDPADHNNDNNLVLTSPPEAGPPERSLGNDSPAPNNRDSVIRQSQEHSSTFMRSESPPPPPPSKDASGGGPEQLPARGNSLSSNPHLQSNQHPYHNSMDMPHLPDTVETPHTSSGPANETHLPPLPQISLTVDDDDKSDYGDNKRMSTKPDRAPAVNLQPTPPEPRAPAAQRKSMAEEDIYDQYAAPDPKRMTMGLRPLPPEDPSDTPEQRANRIRSFYKEYFDDSKPFNEEEHYGHYDDYGDYGDYGEYDYDDYGYDYDYYGDLHWQDGMMPEDVGRRAMTPPPRMAGRFGPGPRNHGAASAIGHHKPGFSSMSSGPPAPGPRAFSSASGRRPPPMPRKPRPPPAPLHELPTPHKLKDEKDVMAIDYAPGAGARDRRAGRPGTPQGGLRPYSPAVPAHSPLASSYDDLAVMPSPHALRKSGTFTALDFAPPPRFREDGTVSDAGSIRSNRSGALSPAQVHSIRSGANRVSRLPQGVVGTKGDLSSNLHPTWNMHR